MLIYHISDLHIGLKLLTRDLLPDQEFILDQITQTAFREKPDAVVISGDLYDKSIPSAEAVDVFDHFVSKLHRELPDTSIMMISGNHDSASRVNLFRSVLAGEHVHMVGMPPRTEEDSIERVTLSDGFGPVNFYLLPFVKPSMVRQIVGTNPDGTGLSYDESLRRLLLREHVDESQRNVLVSHQFYLPAGKDADQVERMGSEICTVGNIDSVRSDVLERFDYAALGHIHKPMKVGNEYDRYSGTPLQYSVSEAGQAKGILRVELGRKENGICERHVSFIGLKPPRQVRIIRGTLEEVLRQSCDDYVRVELTDKEDVDVFDAQDRLRLSFPFLLEITRPGEDSFDEDLGDDPGAAQSPFELLCSFLPDLEEEEKALLQDVINSVKTENG